MTSAAHRAVLRRAMRTGDWEAAEAATRSLAVRLVLHALRRLARRATAFLRGQRHRAW